MGVIAELIKSPPACEIDLISIIGKFAQQV
jgi:hypothetical protein